MLVDEKDPASHDPTKFIGQFYTKEEAEEFRRTREWQMKKDAGRGWRRVVPSPKPFKSVEGSAIRKLVEEGAIVIAAGGGGIPVYIDANGNYEGFDAVIDKDLASAIIAREVGADILAILTSVKRVAINFGRLDQRELDTVKLSEIRKLYGEGHFPPGSMGPKIQAAINFLEGGGQSVVIAALEDTVAAMHGKAGTRIIQD